MFYYFNVFKFLSGNYKICFTGGLAAVIYTDTLQFFVMIIGATIVAVKGKQCSLNESQ